MSTGVGRLKHERVTIPRNEGILEWASQVMHFHADRKSVLEVNLDSIFSCDARSIANCPTFTILLRQLQSQNVFYCRLNLKTKRELV